MLSWGVCREKAAWAREQAKRVRDPETKQGWLDLAAQWEALARTAEAPERDKSAARSPWLGD